MDRRLRRARRVVRSCGVSGSSVSPLLFAVRQQPEGGRRQRKGGDTPLPPGRGYVGGEPYLFQWTNTTRKYSIRKPYKKDTEGDLFLTHDILMSPSAPLITPGRLVTYPTRRGERLRFRTRQWNIAVKPWVDISNKSAPIDFSTSRLVSRLVLAGSPLTCSWISDLTPLRSGR